MGVVAALALLSAWCSVFALSIPVIHEWPKDGTVVAVVLLGMMWWSVLTLTIMLIYRWPKG